MAKAIIERTSCWICGRDVALRDCALDEHGHAVHEECDVIRIKLESQAACSPGKNVAA